MSGGQRGLFDEWETQSKPVPNNGPHITDLVCVDLRYRKELGIRKYGTPLQANNGRDALFDAYEEALDLCQYLKQALLERDQDKCLS